MLPDGIEKRRFSAVPLARGIRHHGAGQIIRMPLAAFAYRSHRYNCESTAGQSFAKTSLASVSSIASFLSTLSVA